jgi:predicted secreted protein
MMIRKDLVAAVLATFCLTVIVFTVIPVGSIGGSRYDPWLDYNDDGKIDVRDVARVCAAYGSKGTPLDKASIQYDSGWINISDKRGQSFIVTHNLNISDWDDPGLMVDITGKTDLSSTTIQRLDYYYPAVNKTYGGTGYERASALVQTADGGYALAGWTESLGGGGFNFWLVKTDAVGNEQWNKTYGGTDDDLAWALVQTADGGYALAGYTFSLGAGDSDFWLVKTDSAGNEQWNKTYGGTSIEEAWALVQTADGGYALGGWTFSFGFGGGDFWLVKTDSAGNEQWNKTYGGESYDQAFTMVQTADEGYALAGQTQSFGAGGPMDFWLVKTDAAGNEQWNKTYGGTDDEEVHALVQTADGGYALAGETWSLGGGGFNSWLVKTDAVGNEQWNKTYGGTEADWAEALVQTADGGYTLAGVTDSFGAGWDDFWLVVTDPDGNLYSRYGARVIWFEAAANIVAFYREPDDTNWNYIRIRILKTRISP